MLKKTQSWIILLLLIPLFLWGCGRTETPEAQSSGEAENTLYVYGPGGPLGPMEELAEKFTEETGIPVKVTAGPESKWIKEAKQQADLVYGGSHYMLRNTMLEHPELIDEKTIEELYPRAAGILVRKGNPKNIRSLEDLTKEGVKILDVNGAGQLGLWEDLAGRKGLIPGISNNIDLSVPNSAKAIELWKKHNKHDAWITYESWHHRLKDVTDLVELPEEEKLYRGTPIAIAADSDQKKDAKQFIEFLKTDPSHQVFQKWGWK
ncbi:accessory colonization factor AcfC [Bhargavaea beijingensis]|uniref:Accessory colonization factor AcfC n=1 Tax=Bhargavaea beijingensis TaxID=426756 RepID=A0A1G7G8Y0_9BACL|nr:accessory colonization factor AcfC [Bhargavaea beijingensis]